MLDPTWRTLSELNLLKNDMKRNIDKVLESKVKCILNAG